MNLLSRKPVKTIDKNSVVERTDNALGLFTEALAALTDANVQASFIVKENEEKISLLSEDNDELYSVVEKNKKVIDNISKLIS